MSKTALIPATRGARFLAKLIDKTIIGVPLFFAVHNALLAMPFERLTDAGLTDDQQILTMAPILINVYLSAGAVLLAVFILQAVFLTRDGQTVGKKALGIRIVQEKSGKNGGFVPNVLLRTLLSGLFNAIPFYGIIDILFIFRDDRRCVHDLLAGTVVVKKA